MSEDFKKIVVGMFKSLDDLDSEGVVKYFSDDVEQVDELAKKWLRGKAICVAAIEGMMTSVSDIKSEVSDLNVISSSDMAIVTCTLNQSYTFEGKSISIVAPTTIAFRLENGVWKAVLLHTVPFA
jgi:ketosteroid isomerase-like protein